MEPGLEAQGSGRQREMDGTEGQRGVCFAFFGLGALG